MKIIEIETASGNLIEFECQMSYEPSYSGGSYEGREWELRGDQLVLDRIYRNGIDVTKRIERLAKKAYKLIAEKSEESF